MKHNKPRREKHFFSFFFLLLFSLLFVVVENPLRLCGSEGPWNATYIYVLLG